MGIRSGVVAVLVGLTVAGVPVVEASTIRNACMGSDRRAATASLCSCIQSVADQILTAQDQRTAAKFFKDPHAAQEIRQSDRARDEAFWQRYRAFGDTARKVCG